MTCHDAREQFTALVDGALDARARTDLDAHMAGCAECRRELDAFRRAVALMRAIEPVRAPAGFVDRVLATARSEPELRRLGRRLFQPWPVKLPLEAAAVLVVGVLAVWLFQRLPEQQRLADSEAPRATYQTRQEPKLERPVAPQKPAEPAPEGGPAPADTRDTAATEPPKSAPLPAPSEEDARRNVVKEAPRVEGLGATAAPSVPAPAVMPAPAPGSRSAAAPAEREQARLRQEKAKALDLVAAPPSEVAGRLAVTDREQTERGLQALVAKHGGRTVWRRGDGRVTLVDVEIPRGEYPRFIADLGRLGRWTVERETRELPETVRVQIQVE